MFSKIFNIIQGERSSGKSVLLWNLSKILKSEGYKICFVGCSDEYSNDGLDAFLTHYDFVRVVPNKVSYSNSQTFDLLKELLERDKYDYLLIDDVDILDKSYWNKIKNISIKKIFTCGELPLIGGVPYNLMKVTHRYDDSDLTTKTFVEYNKQFYTLDSFVSSLLRDVKIKKILK